MSAPEVVNARLIAKCTYNAHAAVLRSYLTARKHSQRASLNRRVYGGPKIKYG
jgi:hypothetical protein